MCYNCQSVIAQIIVKVLLLKCVIAAQLNVLLLLN